MAVGDWRLAIRLWLTAYCLLLTALGSCYSFTGSSLSPDTKTILIKNFPNNSALVNPTLSQDFTTALQNMFLQRTSLKGTLEEPDILIEGQIRDYSISPTSISSNATNSAIATQNKLVITVFVNYENKVEPEKNFSRTFSGEAIFSSDLDINEIETAQVKIANERIINQIFNEIVANW
ncbi:MAG: LPS assembly lipoprotein LptE [Flavobacteriaceae bacterium]|nr:LPS assembly lipoprotein LptE [Flavobacteriaceae bacterium]